ncbi:MAG: type II/IV secretion system ATPase subunit, partial [Methanocorpusculum sp.]|nr:type II/IV secretion system ATPase subunit [Methanocorpusculum sp.]
MKLFGRKPVPQSAGEEPSPMAETPAVLEVPPYEGEGTLLDRYWLTPPFAYANIIEGEAGRILYEVIEPKITKTEYIILEETVRVLRETLIYDNKSAPFPKELDRSQVQEILTSFETGLSEEQIDVLVYYLNRNLLGYGKIDCLLHDEKIEDITCNGADIPVYLYHQKYGNIKTNLSFGGEELNKFVIRLAQIADKQVSLTTPLVDAALPGGARAQLTYSNIVSSKGSSFTIRKFKSEPMTPVDLIRTGTYSSELLALIWLAVENRKSIIIAGGTASGKTSTMNAVS